MQMLFQPQFQASIINRIVNIRSIKIFLLFALLAAFTIYAIFIWKTAIRIKDFRKLPQRSVAEEYFIGNNLHDIFARILIFKPGVSSYECTIRSWAYKSNKISNTILNRWILEKDVSRMTLKERVEHLPEYPLDPKGILPYLTETLYTSSDGYKILLVLAKVKGSNSIYQHWIKKRIVLRNDSKLFIKSIKYIIQLPDIDIGELFDMFLEESIGVTKEDLSTEEFGELGDEYIRYEDCGRDTYLFFMISKFLKIGTDTSESLLNWLNKALSNKKLELSASLAKVISLYTYSTKIQEVKIAQTILLREVGDIDPCEARFFNCSMQAQKELFRETQLSSPHVAIEFFHELAHKNIIEAETIAKPILSGPDSEIRKDVIVLLIRHGSSIGELYLDDAFRGNAKRSMLFQSIDQYTFGSKVVELYCSISRHQYTGIPKTWPPCNIDGSLWKEEVIKWRKFIDEFPWFPGTDDAYYRMGYLQYAFGDLEGAFNTVQEFASREFPDNDSRPYLAHLLRNLSFHKVSLHKRFPELEHVYHLQRLGILLFDDHPDMKNYTKSIYWLLGSTNYQRLLDVDENTLNKMEQIVNDIGNSSNDRRLKILLRRYGNFLDDYNFSQIFYGLSNSPWYPDDLKSKESFDYNYRLISNIAVLLKQECENVNSQNEKRNRILWSLIHFYLMPYDYKDNFAFAVDLAKHLNRQDFQPDLDWLYERIHGEYWE